MEATIQTEPVKTVALSDVLTPDETIVYSRWLHLMNRTAVGYGVGGGFALFAYTGIWRSTKDLDIFLKPVDLKKVLGLMTDAGYRCEVTYEVTYPVWLAKVQRGPYCLDLIFGGNFHGYRVDDLLLSADGLRGCWRLPRTCWLRRRCSPRRPTSPGTIVSTAPTSRA